MNSINVYRMIYNHYSKWGISLTAQQEKPGPLKTEDVRKTVLSAIENSLESGQNPSEILKESDLTQEGTQWGMPEMNNPDDRQMKMQLVQWIMKSDQMQEALNLFRSSSGLTVEQIPEEEAQTDLYSLILGITQVEADFQ